MPRIENIKDQAVDTTIEISTHVVKYSLVVVLVYLVITMLYLIYTKRETFFENIATWSIGGFWAFFMGYFGWLFAESITKSFSRKIKKGSDNDD